MFELERTQSMTTHHHRTDQFFLELYVTSASVLRTDDGFVAPELAALVRQHVESGDSCEFVVWYECDIEEKPATYWNPPEGSKEIVPLTMFLDLDLDGKRTVPITGDLESALWQAYEQEIREEE